MNELQAIMVMEVIEGLAKNTLKELDSITRPEAPNEVKLSFFMALLAQLIELQPGYLK